MRLNKLVKRIFAVGMAVSLMMANAGVSFADYSVNGEKTNLDKYLIMGKDANVPNVEFAYTIAPGTAIAAGTDTLAVLAGPTGATIGTAKFTAGQTTYDTVQTGDTVTLPNNKKYAKSPVEVDLSNVTFTEPGVYRYIITEKETEMAGITYDTEKTRTLDVYVEDNSTEAEGTTTLGLKVAGYVLHKGTDAPKADGTDPEGKKSGFENSYETHNLTFSKSVSGNQASRTKAFTFTLKIEDAVDGTVFSVKVNGAASDNLVIENGSVEKTYSLKHGDSVEVDGLAPKTSYTISEAAEDYTPSYVIDKGGATDGNNTGKQAISNADVTVAFTNTREGTIPTGVILDSAPFILIIGLAAAALIFTAARKKVR